MAECTVVRCGLHEKSLLPVTTVDLQDSRRDHSQCRSRPKQDDQGSQ